MYLLYRKDFRSQETLLGIIEDHEEAHETLMILTTQARINIQAALSIIKEAVPDFEFGKLKKYAGRIHNNSENYSLAVHALLSIYNYLEYYDAKFLAHTVVTSDIRDAYYRIGWMTYRIQEVDRYMPDIEEIENYVSDTIID